jgi:hypothetical protein
MLTDNNACGFLRKIRFRERPISIENLECERYSGKEDGLDFPGGCLSLKVKIPLLLPGEGPQPKRNASLSHDANATAATHSHRI